MARRLPRIVCLENVILVHWVNSSGRRNISLKEVLYGTTARVG